MAVWPGVVLSADAERLSTGSPLDLLPIGARRVLR